MRGKLLEDVSEFVQHASSTQVIIAGAHRIGVDCQSWPFISASSPIVDFNAKRHINSLYKKQQIDSGELADYLALASSCHLLDGWRYISNATLALLRGSRSIALHLAYYAELRAGMSILAGAGIGIVDRCHFSIGEDSSIRWGGAINPGMTTSSGVDMHRCDSNDFSYSTHQLVRAALSQWTNNVENSLAIINCFYAYGLSASEWVEGYRTDRASLSQVAQAWMCEWSRDLLNIGQDKEQRNLQSYNPNLYADAFFPVTSDEVNMIITMMDSCIPTSSPQLGELDLAIIRNLLECARKQSIKKSHEFWNDLSGWLIREKGFQPKEAVYVRKCVKQAAAGVGGKIVEAAHVKNKSITGVLCRSFLLLRLAAVLTKSLWSEMSKLTNCNPLWIDELLSMYGRQSQLWEEELPQNSLILLEADVDELMERVKARFSSRVDHSELLKSKDIVLNLCQFERIGLMAAAI